jgi:hypothetical protein
VRGGRAPPNRQNPIKKPPKKKKKKKKSPNL